MEPTSAEILELIEQGKLAEARELLWAPETSLGWLLNVAAPSAEIAGDHFAKSNKDRALWCYEQAQALYNSFAASATSGGEGMARQMENLGGHIGRKIWMLKS